jgi:hypothetical protein
MAVSSSGLYVMRIARFSGDGNGKHFAEGSGAGVMKLI